MQHEPFRAAKKAEVKVLAHQRVVREKNAMTQHIRLRGIEALSHDLTHPAKVPIRAVYVGRPVREAKQWTRSR